MAAAVFNPNKDVSMKDFKIRIESTQIWLVDVSSNDLNNALEQAKKIAISVMDQCEPNESKYIVSREAINLDHSI